MNIKQIRFRFIIHQTIEMKTGYFVRLLLLMIIATSISSCRKIECESFDLEHKTMDWHFFPELKDDYQFKNSDSNSVIFHQTKYDINDYEERRCHMCACFQRLETVYENNDLDVKLENFANYDTEHSGWEGTIYYRIDDIDAAIDIEGDGITEYVPDGESQEFTFISLESIELHGVVYKNITQFEILDETKTKIDIFWIQNKNGIIGFQIEDEIWIRE